MAGVGSWAGLGNRGIGNKVAPVGLILGRLLWPLEALQATRAMLFPWIAVLIGCGIGGWFSVRDEPGAGG